MNSTKIITEDITTNLIDSICIPIQSSKTIDLEITDNFNKCLIYLDKTYNKNVWKYLNDLNEVVQDDQSSIQTDYKSGIHLILECLYGKSTQNSINSNHLLNLKEYTPIETSSFNIVYDTTDLNNLHQLLLYSPHSIDNNNEKILFIFYQLLKLFKYLHSINLNCSDLKLNDIYVDKNYWIKIKPPIKSILNQYLTTPTTNELKETQEQLQHDNEDENNIKFYFIKENLKFKYDSLKHLNFKDLSNLTKQWCDNKISNFDYLLILNCLAGKQLDSPFNHPIFPWITDFQSFNTNLRDLSISKFRLNKGDTHLDMTYQAAKQLNTTPPYHITEFLSEITYFVYKSRQTDKQTLCQHVRSNWVPNEYPKSIDRLYIWTPEECIPEFYCDSNIFKSIHDDLPDLQVPNWCNGSVDEFIRTHRLLLESDLVSKKLHNWIDLVFGYKLTGDAAIESKNVCLQLVDNNSQTIMKPFGIVQLFTIQHPYRSLDKYYHCKQPPNIINRSRLKNDCLDDSSKKVKYASYTQAQLESAELLRKRSATTTNTSVSTNYDLITNQQIQLPDDYTNPLLVCDQIETLLKFTNKIYHCLPDLQQKQQQQIKVNKTFQDFISLDMKCLACLLAEICFFNRLKCLPQENSLETRCSFINKMFIKEPHLLSGPYALFISSILKPHNNSNNNNNTKNKSNKFIENLLKYQSNFINIDLMLNLNTTILPFKSYLEQFYKFSKRFHIINNLIQNYAQLNPLQIKQEINSLMKLKQQDQQIDQIELNEHLNQLSLSYLPLLMSELSDPKKTQLTQSYCSSYTDSFELLLPILEHLFSNPYTCIDSFLYLFTRMTRYVSKQIVYKKFLPILLHMLNVVDLNETIGLNIANTNEDDIKKHKFLKLFEFKFINELRIIFGLELFLTQIFPLIIEAISGFKDLDFTTTTPPDLVDNNQNETIIINNQQKMNDVGGIFDFETDLNKVIEEEEEIEIETEEEIEQDIQKGSSINDSQSLTDTSQNNNNNISNISIISFNTFTRIIITIGPVLTCKYCCRDLLKMLAICYMNMKCLNKMDESNPLNSVRPIEGDRFASLILESLKYVAVLYSDQVIVLQYLTHVSNSISSATNKLTIRLEASLLAGCVLVSYFLNYLDIKLLMDNLNYILYQILQPVILLYSNFETIKFPSGVLMRQCIAFKVLDIILLLSLRIGPEQTRIEMEFIIKAYFDAFSLVGNSKLVSSKPLTAIKNSIQIKRQSIVAFNIDEYLKFSYDKSTNEIIGSSLGSKLGSSSDTTSDASDQTTKYRTHSIGLLSLNIDEQTTVTPSINNNNNSLETNEELINTFTNELANIGYYSISRLNSGVYIDSILKNSDLIHQMCNQFDLEQKKQKKTYNYNIPSSMTMEYGKSPPIKSNYNKSSSSYSSSFSENVSVSGNQIQFQNQNELSINNNSFILKFNENELKENKFKIDTSRHLTDNWLAYWENEIRNNNNEIHSQFDFKHINLLTLSGHTSAVKCLLSLENESCLISGSKDKTVKLWSIKNQMGSSNKKTPQSCQWTYKNHKKPVFSLIFIESQRLCASSDMSSVHVWDPFIGRKLIQLEINNNNNNNISTSTNSQLNITSMASLQMPASSFILSTNDNLIKFIDLRINSFTHEFKTCHSSSSLSSNGTIKSISACDNNLLVFFSTGLICLLDIRTGWLVESFKNHDNELIQGKFYGQQQFVTTYNDGSIGFSLIKEKCHLKKLTKNYSEPVAFMSSTDQQLITSTSSNKIGIHSNINQLSSQITFTVDKLKTDYFKGFITSQTYLKLNRLLLFGSDYGDIRVLC